MRALLTIATMVLGAGVAQGQMPEQAAWAPVTPKAVLAAAVAEVIRPNILQLDEASGGLDRAMEALCATPSADSLAIAADQFGQVVRAYGAIAFLRLGPLLEDNRADRLLFWPDRRSIGLKQVQAILATEDASATELASLQGKSVAVQGLGALEFVLFGTGAEALSAEEGAFRCRYGQTIAANIAAMAGELTHDWYRPDGIASHLQTPQPDYSDYRTETEALEALVGLVSHGLEALRDKHLLAFMARDNAAARPKLAVFWRSDLTMAYARANIEGMRKLVAASGVARAVSEKQQGLENTIDFEFRNAIRALDLITLPVAAAVADEKQAAALSYLVLVTGSLQSIIGEQLSAALGLSVGFSALDGD